MLKRSLLLVLITFVCCVGAFAQKGDPWKKFTSEGGKFSVTAPCDPEVSSEDLTSGTSVIKQIYNTCVFERVGYIVSYADFTGATTAKKLLDEFRDGILTGSQMTAAGERNISLSSYPGREFSTTSNPTTSKETQLFYSWHVYDVNGRVYGLGVVTKGFEPDAADVSKFFSSFALEK